VAVVLKEVDEELAPGSLSSFKLGQIKDLQPWQIWHKNRGSLWRMSNEERNI